MGLSACQLAVFVRPPVPGQTKTRLAKEAGAEFAAELYAAFVRDTLEACAAVPDAQIVLWSSAESDLVCAWANAHSAPLRIQPSGDLGARIAHAFEQGLKTCESVVVVGSDAPTVRTTMLSQAIGALHTTSLVAGPTADGGYYLIGARDQPPSLHAVRWSSTHTLADTRTANASRPLALLEPHYDIDDAADLLLLRTHLALDPSLAPHTRAALVRFGAL